MKSSTENPHEWHEYSEERNTYIALDTTQHGVVVTEFDCYGLPDRTVRRALWAGLPGMSRSRVLSEVNAPVMWGGLSHMYYEYLLIASTVVSRV